MLLEFVPNHVWRVDISLRSVTLSEIDQECTLGTTHVHSQAQLDFNLCVHTLPHFDACILDKPERSRIRSTRSLWSYSAAYSPYIGRAPKRIGATAAVFGRATKR